MSYFLSLLSENTARDKTLRNLKECLSNAKDESEKAVHIDAIESTSNLLRESYHHLIVTYPSESAEHDVHGSLWKQCYYKQIEEYRQNIRQVGSFLMERRDEQQRAKLHLIRLSTAFGKFVEEASFFYCNLMLEFESIINGHPNTLFKESSDHIYLYSIYRCLLYLGDLARYQASTTTEPTALPVKKSAPFGGVLEAISGTDGKWQSAISYYERATHVFASFGNPHNQMAVIAMTSSSACDSSANPKPIVIAAAIYHYCRSILIPKPFYAGLENLEQAFKYNAKQLLRLPEDSPAKRLVEFPSSSRSTTAGQNHKKGTGATAKAFLIRFVHLHQMIYSYVRKPSQFDLTGKNDDNIPFQDKFITLMTQTLQDFDVLLHASSGVAVDSALLLRLFCISLFSLYVSSPTGIKKCRANISENNTNVWKPFSQQAESATAGLAMGPALSVRSRTLPESLVIVFVFNFIIRMLSALKEKFSVAPHSSSRSGSTTDKEMSPLVQAVFPVVSLFCQWAGHNPHYLIASSVELSNKQTTTPESNSSMPISADMSLLRIETRVRSALRASFSALNTVLLRGVTRSTGTGDVDSTTLLKEYVELRGFIPLNCFLEPLFDKLTCGELVSGAQVAQTTLSNAHLVRRAIVMTFMNQIFFIAQQETKVRAQLEKKEKDETIKMQPQQKDREVKVSVAAGRRDGKKLVEPTARPLLAQQPSRRKAEKMEDSRLWNPNKPGVKQTPDRQTPAPAARRKFTVPASEVLASPLPCEGNNRDNKPSFLMAPTSYMSPTTPLTESALQQLQMEQLSASASSTFCSSPDPADKVVEGLNISVEVGDMDEPNQMTIDNGDDDDLAEDVIVFRPAFSRAVPAKARVPTSVTEAPTNVMPTMGGSSSIFDDLYSKNQEVAAGGIESDGNRDPLGGYPGVTATSGLFSGLFSNTSQATSGILSDEVPLADTDTVNRNVAAGMNSLFDFGSNYDSKEIGQQSSLFSGSNVHMLGLLSGPPGMGIAPAGAPAGPPGFENIAAHDTCGSKTHSAFASSASLNLQDVSPAEDYPSFPIEFDTSDDNDADDIVQFSFVPMNGGKKNASTDDFLAYLNSSSGGTS